MTSAEAAVARFNAMINSRDLDGLASLMTDGHTFIGTTGHAVAGKQSCREAWSGFFAAYPSYRNLFESVHEEDGLVVIVGRSVCSDDPALDGPALWTARVEGNLVTEWRVYDDTPEARHLLAVGSTGSQASVKLAPGDG